jgi:hypothetical protein
MENELSIVRAHANALGAALRVSDSCKCFFCGASGEYRKDIVDTDYRDHSGHDTVVEGCKDTENCLDRVSKRW